MGNNRNIYSVSAMVEREEGQCSGRNTEGIGDDNGFFVAHPAHFFALVLQAVLFQTTKKATSNGLGNVCYLKRNI